MDVKESGGCLESLTSSFNARVVELQELVIARNMYPATAISDLSAVDTAVKTLEYQMQAIKDRLREEAEAIPKARKLIDQSLRQQRKLQHMLAHMPSCFQESTGTLNRNPTCAIPEASNHDIPSLSSKVEESAAPRKEKRGHTSSPRWYITAEELDTLSSYMRGRLTLEKVNAAVNEMAIYADANAQLIAAPKNKLSEDTWGRALGLRDIAMEEPVKGKHFFLDSDMKGSALKLDNTGKAILTAYIVGEHGDSSVALWSSISIGGVPVLSFLERQQIVYEKEALERIHRAVVASAGEVIQLKGYTSWAIGYSVASIARTILRDQRRIHPVSVLAKGFYGIGGDGNGNGDGGEVFLSLPAQLGHGGVLGVTQVHLTEEEASRLSHSAGTILEVQSHLALGSLH